MTKKLNGKKVPNLRFPGFKEEWVEKKLGEVADFKVTNSFSRENLNYENGTVKNIHYGDIHTKFQTLFDINKENVPYINERTLIDKISKDFYCKEGDVVFADASEDLNDVGKSIEIVNLNNEKLLSGLHTLLARPKGNIFYKGFNGYLFKSNSVRTQIQREAQGTKVLSISAGRISNIELSFPSLPEQLKITSFLSLIDERITTQRKMIEQLTTLSKSLRECLFTRKWRFKNHDGNDFPDWEFKRLGKVYSFKMTNSFSRENLNYENGSVKNIHYGDIHTKFQTLFDVTKEIVPFINSEISIGKISKDNYCKEGDIIFADASEDLNDVGKSIEIVKLNGEKLVSGLHTILARPDSTKMSVGFGSYLFQSSSVRLQIQKESQGTKVLSISAKRLSNIKILTPCIEEQNRITNFLSALDEKIDAEKRILQQYEMQKKYLLQNLFI